MKHNGKNERIKRRYARYLQDARRQSEPSIDTALAAIDRFEECTKRRDFALFRVEQASAFKDHLARLPNERTKKPLSPATQLHILAALRAFVTWLADQSGYRQRIRYSDADYFSLSLKQTAIAKAERGIEGPTVDQVRHVVNQMPHGTDIAQRDRALIAFALISGARDDAIASLRLKHIDLVERIVQQDARDVRTKASKTINTWFFPVGEDFVGIVEEWVRFLRQERQWGLNDPLFPKTKIAPGASRRFEPIGLERTCWTTASPVRAIFRSAFTAAGLPYFNPHSLRKTLARLGQELCNTPEQFKAWSQNLGHEKVLTTLTSYGRVDHLRQRDIIRSLGQPKSEAGDVEAMLLRALEATRSNQSLA